MATFSNSQITDIATIFGVSSDVVNNRLIYFQNTITDEDKTKVIALIAEFAEVDGNYASFTPTESNEGFNLRADSQKDTIRRRLGGLLHCEDFASQGGSMLQSEFIRG